MTTKSILLDLIDEQLAIIRLDDFFENFDIDKLNNIIEEDILLLSQKRLVAECQSKQKRKLKRRKEK